MIRAIAPIMWPHVIPFILTLNIYSNTRATLKEATLASTPLLCRMSHCFIVRLTALSRVSLLCYSIYYSAVGFTTPPWVSLLCYAFYSSNSLQVNLVCVNKLLKSQTHLALCYSISRVGFSIDSLDIGNQASLISLSKAHNINHKSLFLYSSKAYKTVIKRLRVCNLNQRQVNL
jgi:hypothetical protein